MSWFDDCIDEGVWSGMVTGFHKAWDEHLINDAVEFLNKENYTASSPKERGIRKALVDLGYLKRKWFIGSYIRTDKPIKGNIK